MMRAPVLAEAPLASLLGRASPLVKVAVAAAWLAGLVAVVAPRPALELLVAALVGARLLGALPFGTMLRAVAPLWLAALAIAAFNIVFAGANADPTAVVVGTVGPLRVTAPAVATGLALGLRILVIGALSVAFAQTTEATRLADALVQQARLPERFAYGALAAYRAVPGLSEDLATLRDARRIRGLRASWHPRLLIALLVLAVRHAERLAMAMDARGFDVPGPRTRFRTVRWGRPDAVVGLLGLGVLLLVMVTA